jgi:hypothetical protein
MFCRSLFVLFLLVIVLSVLRRFIDSGYPFGIFKLFLLSTMTQLIPKYLSSPTGFCVGMLLKLRWFPPNPPVSCIIGGTNKTYPNDIAEILLKLALNTIKQTNKHIIPNLPLLYFPTFPSCGIWMFNATIEYIALKVKATSQTFSYNLFIKLLTWIWRQFALKHASGH